MKKAENNTKRSYKECYNLIRNSERIRSSDIIEKVFEDLSYYNCPDPSMVVAKGTINGITCMILGQEKRRQGKESKATGMVTSEGHSFILDMLDVAEGEGLAIVSFIDTFGGNTSMESELGGQSFLISDCITRFCEIKTPTLSFVIGEGGSGGALAIQVADKSFMLENALYSVIAPESCSRIIFHKRLEAGEELESTVKDALEMLKPGAENVKEIGMIDEILPEPEEGAHVDYDFTINEIKKAIKRNLKNWIKIDKKGNNSIPENVLKRLLKKRREKVLNYGEFHSNLNKLKKRRTKTNIEHDEVKTIDIERENFHTSILIKAHLEKQGINETELVNCEEEWNVEQNLFRVAGGCGFIPVKDYIDNYYACPKCGKGEYLSAEEQIEKICDKNTFLEIEGGLTTRKLIGNERFFHGKYKALLEKMESKCFSKEGLVTGTAKINDKDVVIAITDLKFIGGSFGSAFGEKFKRAVDFSVKNDYPFISICSSGGARMNEGTMALAQMAKMNMSILDLKRAGVLYLSVIATPTTGGAYASYVTQGDIMIGEKGSLIEFAGPRVVTGAGFEVDKEIVCTDNLYKTGKIQHLVMRKELKGTLSYYVKFFYDIKFPKTRKHSGRIKDFRFSPSL